MSAVKKTKGKALNVGGRGTGAPQKQGSTSVGKRKRTADVKAPGSAEVTYVFPFLSLPFYAYKIHPSVSKQKTKGRAGEEVGVQ